MKSLSALWYRGGQIQVRFARQISTSVANFGLVRDSPARPRLASLRRLAGHWTIYYYLPATEDSSNSQTCKGLRYLLTSVLYHNNL